MTSLHHLLSRAIQSVVAALAFVCAALQLTPSASAKAGEPVGGISPEALARLICQARDSDVFDRRLCEELRALGSFDVAQADANQPFKTRDPPQQAYNTDPYKKRKPPQQTMMVDPYKTHKPQQQAVMVDPYKTHKPPQQAILAPPQQAIFTEPHKTRKPPQQASWVDPTKKYGRTAPPGPGLLESSPGGSPQAPSGMGTPKPSAPPPVISR